MIKYSRLITTACAVALAGGLLVGCGSSNSSDQQSSAPSEEQTSQQAASSAEAASGEAASSAVVQQSTEELMTELENALADQEYTSVTVKGDATLSSSGQAAVSTATSTDADADEALEGDEELAETDATDDADATQSEVEGSDASAATATPAASGAAATAPTSETVSFELRADVSGSEPKMQVKLLDANSSTDVYVNGTDTVVVIDGKAASATLEELDMEEYASVDAILQDQGVDISAYRNAVENIVKTTEGDQTVYALECAPSRISVGDESASQLPDDVTIDAANVEYRFDADGKLAQATVEIKAGTFTVLSEVAFSAYDSTTVPDAPAPTMTYAELMESTSSSVGEANGSSLLDGTGSATSDEDLGEYDEVYYEEDIYYDDADGEEYDVTDEEVEYVDSDTGEEDVSYDESVDEYTDTEEEA